MGICHSTKSIEQIIHSKYTLAKDPVQKHQTNEYQHIYIWKYSADDLAQKEVRFYDSDNDFVNDKQSKKQPNEQQQNQAQFLVSEPVSWPIKAHANEGYIILTINNNTKQLQALALGSSQPTNEPNSLIIPSSIGSIRVPLQVSQLLYMIKLDSLRPYYYSKVDQKTRECSYQGEIQIVVGDLIQRVECLKLVTIAYQLEKYLQRGGQNVLKKFYNQFEQIYYIQNSPFNTIDPDTKLIAKQSISLQDNKQHLVEAQIPFERLFLNQINRIQNSSYYPTEEQKLKQIKKIFTEFFQILTKYNVLITTLFAHLKLQDFKQQSQQCKKSTPNNTKYSKTFPSPQIQTRILQQCKSSVSQFNQNRQRIHIFHTIKPKDLNNLQSNQVSNKRPPQFEDFSNISADDHNDISIIEKPKGATTNRDSHIKLSQEKNQLDTSSPFICEITEIDGFNEQQNADGEAQTNVGGRVFNKRCIEKNMIIQKAGDVEDSLFLPKELEQLRVNKTIYQVELAQKLTQQKQPIPIPILISTYPGSSQFQQLQSLKVSLIVNMSPWQCYNYFINDMDYEWYNVEPLKEEEINMESIDFNQQRIGLLNFECVLRQAVDRIERHLQQCAKETQNMVVQSIKKQVHPKVLIFCSHANLTYSGTLAMAYLMFSNQYKLTFEQAYESIRQSTKTKFILPKVYEHQLKELQKRVNELSSTVNLNCLNTKSSSSRTYEVGLYSKKDLGLIVGRYIGQLSSSNQLQLLPNNSIKAYFLVPNNLTSIVVKSINILREDPSIVTNNNEKLSNTSKLIKNMGLTLRFFHGKQLTNQQKKAYFNFVHDELLSQLVRYEYANFPKHIFHVQKYKAKIDLIIQSLKQLITVEAVEKSFRKPQPIQQSPLSVVNDIDLLKSTPLTEKQQRQQPFNNKQILTFKYPILRPIFESKKKESYYFMIKKFKQNHKGESVMGCNVAFYKGENWIGLQEDKQRYFQKIVEQYLKEVPEERIWIEDEQSGADQSLFDRDSIFF